MKIGKILAVFLVIFVISCTQEEQKDASDLTPEEVVETYFNSWNQKDYRTMYSLISDGFKKIEPTAQTYEKFSGEMSKYYSTANGIRTLEIQSADVSGDTATIAYKIELDLKAGKKEYEGVYTLKNRYNGWKLIHPYGENIDTD